MSTKFDDFLQEQLQDLEFKREYEMLQTEHMIVQAINDDPLLKESFDREIEKGIVDIETGCIISAETLRREMKNDFGV